MSNDPFSNSEYFRQESRRGSTAGTSPAKLARYRVEAFACKQLCLGLNRNDLYRAAWKFADTSRGRSYMGLDDFHQVVPDCPFIFKLLHGNKATTGIVGKVGAYLDGYPKILLKSYHDWVEHVSTYAPGQVPILMFRLPFLPAKIAVLREGDAGNLGESTSGRFVYYADDTCYVIQSARSFGADTVSAW